jgi:hypothetical protein
MKSGILLLTFSICTLLAHLPAGAQLRNNYYFAPDSKAQVDKLRSIAILPAWVSLEPSRYEGLPGELQAKEKDASDFVQNLMFSALIRTDTLRDKKLQDMYSTNERLAMAKANNYKVALERSPSQLCDLVEADAVLLTLVSHDNNFVTTNPAVAQIVQSMQWNKPISQKDVILVLFHKSGQPIWAASFRTGGVSTSLREEYQLYMGDVLSIYGYTGKM